MRWRQGWQANVVATQLLHLPTITPPVRGRDGSVSVPELSLTLTIDNTSTPAMKHGAPRGAEALAEHAEPPHRTPRVSATHYVPDPSRAGMHDDSRPLRSHCTCVGAAAARHTLCVSPSPSPSDGLASAACQAGAAGACCIFPATHLRQPTAESHVPFWHVLSTARLIASSSRSQMHLVRRHPSAAVAARPGLASRARTCTQDLIPLRDTHGAPAGLRYTAPPPHRARSPSERLGVALATKARRVHARRTNSGPRVQAKHNGRRIKGNVHARVLSLEAPLLVRVVACMRRAWHAGGVGT